MKVNIILKDGTLLRKVILFREINDFNNCTNTTINSKEELINFIKTNSHITYCGEYVNGNMILNAIESYSTVEE